VIFLVFSGRSQKVEEIICFIRKESLEDEFHAKKEVLRNTAGSERRFEKLKRVHGGLDTRAQPCTYPTILNPQTSS